MSQTVIIMNVSPAYCCTDLLFFVETVNSGFRNRFQTGLRKSPPLEPLRPYPIARQDNTMTSQGGRNNSDFPPSSVAAAPYVLISGTSWFFSTRGAENPRILRPTMDYTLLHILSEARILYTAIKKFGVNCYYRLRAYAFSVISNDKNKVLGSILKTTSKSW